MKSKPSGKTPTTHAAPSFDHRPPNHIRITTVHTLPESVADYRDWIGALEGVFGQEGSAENGSDSEHVEQVGRAPYESQLTWFFFDRDGRRDFQVDGHFFKCARTTRVLQVPTGGNAEVDLVIPVRHQYETVGLFVVSDEVSRCSVR